jgi:dockerin type I repeat protein
MSKRNPFKAIALVTGLVASISFVGCGESVVGPAPARQTTFTPRTPMPPVEFAKGEITPTAVPCEGSPDLNRDGYVDASDLSFFSWILGADMNGDGQVSARDAEILGAVIEYQATSKLGDLNGDGRTDASDISVLSLALSRADLNRSGRVDASDLSLYSFMVGRGDLDRDGVVSGNDQEIVRRHVGEIAPVNVCA